MNIKELNELSYEVIGAAYTVHRALRPGLLESSYEACLEYEMISRDLVVERQKPLPLVYRHIHIDAGYRVDLLVNKALIVEVKSVESINPIFQGAINDLSEII